MKNLFKVSAVVLGLVASVSANAAIIQNGSFEEGTYIDGGYGFATLSSGSTAMPGWNVGLNGVDWINSYWAASDGKKSLDLSAGNVGKIWQSITLTPGQQYTVSFDMAGNWAGGNSTKYLTAVISDSVNDFNFDTQVNNSTATNMGWQTKSFTFTALSASNKLTFISQESNAFGAAIDNVSISPVPEAEEWAMMMLGLPLIGFVARRRQAA